MNTLFQSHVTSSAFSLTLSRPMIQRLLRMDFHEAFYFDGTPHNLVTMAALQDRGLVFRDEEAALPSFIAGTFSGKPVWVLTEEGRAVVVLLKLAGFKVEMEEQLRQVCRIAGVEPKY